MLDRIMEGRTDLVFEWVGQGGRADATDPGGVPLVRWCAYYGDVSALRFLLAQGAGLQLLGSNLDLNGAAFHGHWQLCEFLLSLGADPNHPAGETRETPLHAAFTKREWHRQQRVAEVLLAAGADPNAATCPGVETGSFMRDVRTCGETPLHRAAAYGTADAVSALLASGGRPDARDANGDSPLSWASRALRSADILHLLCFPPHQVRPDRPELSVSLIGRPAS